jgi:hypothetical protein
MPSMTVSLVDIEEVAMTNMQALRLCLLVGTNAGGEGKTWFSMLISALFALSDEDVALIDADMCNRAACHIGGIPLDPFGDPEKVVPRLIEDIGGRKSMIVDSGANILAASKEYEDTLRDVGIALADSDYIVSACWLVSTNKIGAAGSVVKLAKRMANPFGPIFVFNDRDGSGSIPEGINPDIKVEHLQPGLVALVNARGGFASLIKTGIPGHQHSADLIAAYLWRFADQPGIRVLFGNDWIDSLMPTLKRNVLNLSPYSLKKPTDDAAMEILARRAKVLRFIDPYLDDINELIKALQRFMGR